MNKHLTIALAIATYLFAGGAALAGHQWVKESDRVSIAPVPLARLFTKASGQFCQRIVGGQSKQVIPAFHCLSVHVVEPLRTVFLNFQDQLFLPVVAELRHALVIREQIVLPGRIVFVLYL